MKQTRRADRELQIECKDKMNWVTVPVGTNMSKPKSKWVKIVHHRQYLLEIAEKAYLAPETMNRYIESLSNFKVQLPYILEQDNNKGEWHIKLVKEDGVKSYVYSSRDKERLHLLLFEYLLKSKVINGLTIDDSLKELYQES